jgi:hypothetical protein
MLGTVEELSREVVEVIGAVLIIDEEGGDIELERLAAATANVDIGASSLCREHRRS